MLRGGSPEIREIFLALDNNEDGLKRPDWFRNLARQLGFSKQRVKDLFYDEECKTKDWEYSLIQKSLRKQTELNKKLEYQKYVSREILNERQTSGLPRSPVSGNCGNCA